MRRDAADEPRLETTPEGLSLVAGEMRLIGDFTSMLPRLKPHALGRELLVKAAKIRHVEEGQTLRAVDATAGLGEDSILLAASGFHVTMFEHDPLIAALLRDALERASHVEELGVIVSHMELVEGDSISGMASLDFAPDVVYLDPMFPAKRSASAKKKLQLFQRLESPCSDEEALLEAALALDPRKVVVKRPLKGPQLAGAKPSHAIKGKTVRYDCIVCSPR